MEASEFDSNSPSEARTAAQNAAAESAIDSNIEADYMDSTLDHEEEEETEVDLNLYFNEELGRYTFHPLPKMVSFDDGFYHILNGIEILREKLGPNETIIVAIAGPAGAGKSTLAGKISKIFQGIVINVDAFLRQNIPSTIRSFDPTSIDFPEIVRVANELVESGFVELKYALGDGTRSFRVLPSRLVIFEGVFALYRDVREFSDITVGMSGGVHLDLIKTIVRDSTRSLSKREAVLNVANSLFPLYKAYIEPDMQYAMVHIHTRYNPMKNFSDPLYVFKCKFSHVEEHLSEYDEETQNMFKTEGVSRSEVIQDLYFYPPKYDSQVGTSTGDRRNWIRIRRNDGRFFIYFYSEQIGNPVNVRPTLQFEVPIQAMAGLLALGYQIGASLNRKTVQLYNNNGIVVTREEIRELSDVYIQIKGHDRRAVIDYASKLNVMQSHISKSFLYLYFQSLKVKEMERIRRRDASQGGSPTKTAVAVPTIPAATLVVAPKVSPVKGGSAVPSGESSADQLVHADDRTDLVPNDPTVSAEAEAEFPDDDHSHADDLSGESDPSPLPSVSFSELSIDGTAIPPDVLADEDELVHEAM